MVLSRGLSALKLARALNPAGPPSLQASRSSHTWNYRSLGAGPPPWVLRTAELVQGVAWWWVLWHLFTEPGHVLGEFPYPDPRTWTDEELGIPPAE